MSPIPRISLSFFCFFATAGPAQNSLPYIANPKTIDEAAQWALNQLNDDDRRQIARMPRELVVTDLVFAWGFGTGFDVGEESRTVNTLEDCDLELEESCAAQVVGATWDLLRADMNPEFASALDCQFELVRKIEIDVTGFSTSRIGDVILSTENQIKAYMDAGKSACTDSLSLNIENSPDLTCWTRYEMNEPARLYDLLNWMSWRNGFRFKHAPPKINLAFYERCSWPDLPRHFQPGNE